MPSPENTQNLPGIDIPDRSLLTTALEEELKHQYQQDARLRPFIDLLAAYEDPDVDYSSPAVRSIIEEMRRLNEGFEENPVPTQPFPTIVPFEPMLGVDKLVESIVQEVGDVLVEAADGIANDAGKILGELGAEDDEQIKKKPFLDTADIEQLVDGRDLEIVFRNWGKTVNFRASHTLVVHSVAGICKVVKWAASVGRRVRVTGFRHSWSEVFGKDGDVLMMFLPYDTLVDLPYKDPPPSWKTDLSGISPVASVAGRTASDGHAFYKIMAGTTNEQFRQWCFDNKTFCLPLNVIMVEVTFGGTNAPICHGSGLTTSTLSDLVVEVEYVDAKGIVRTVNDKKELLAASGAFGLLGVVVSITLQLDTMGVTDMMPVKLPVPLGIPPPPGYPIPNEIQELIRVQGITQAQLDVAQKDFEKRCENDYYLEWFWFPYQGEVWVNTWSKRPITSQDVNREAYPGDGLLDGVKSQEVQASLAEALVSYTPFRWLSGRLQAYTMGLSALLALPSITQEKDAIKTFQSEAMHFRRGIQNFRCWDSEWEIPVPKVDGKPKYEIIQRAWWDGISAIYSRKDAPVRVALEMRLTGGSDVLLAPQRGNDYTASIEVLTTLITPKDDWLSFMQQIADKWTSYDTGSALPRPHWAKQWAGIKVRGKPIERYLKEDAYKGAFEEFRTAFKGIVEKNGSTVEETLAMFGNDLMKRLIFQ